MSLFFFFHNQDFFLSTVNIKNILSFRNTDFKKEYHNYNRNDAYAHGYEKGADERQANLSHHHRRGGYSRIAQFKDVEGMRGPRARDLLADRGFTRVSRFGDDNTRYSIMWRSESRQCIQLTIADGRVYDARDIGNHPDCRG